MSSGQTQEPKYSSSCPDSQSNSNFRVREPEGTKQAQSRSRAEAAEPLVLIPEPPACLFHFNSKEAEVPLTLLKGSSPLIIYHLIYSTRLLWILNP